MSDEEPDVHRLWRGQPREEPAIPIDDIRSKAERFARKTRRWNIATVVLFGALIIVEGWQVWREPLLLERVGDSLTIAALIAVAFRLRGYVISPGTSPGLAMTSSVEFYRQELTSQRDLARHPWRYLILFVPGVALSLFGNALNRPATQNAAIAVFGVALFLGVAWLNSRTARTLQRDIDELA